MAAKTRNSWFRVKVLLILGLRKHSSGFVQLLFIASSHENFDLRCFSVGGSSGQLRPISHYLELSAFRTMLLWFPNTDMESRGKNFVLIFNVKIVESYWERPSVDRPVSRNHKNSGNSTMA